MSATMTAPAPAPAATPGGSEAMARRTMIDTQLRPNGVNDPALLAAIDSVDRSAHVPASAAATAYVDRAIALGGGRALNPVLTTARLIGDVGVRSGQHILIVGGATGYCAAILHAMGARVTMVESDSALMAAARNALTGCDGVTFVNGPLSNGAPDGAPFDALIIDGAVDHVPAALATQLNAGARVATGHGDGAVTHLARGVRVAGTETIGLIDFADLECVALPGFAPPPQFRF